MGIGDLPDEGELRLGSVSLPPGKWVRAGHESMEPVAWVTRGKVPEAGRVWAALSDARPQTGLVPFLLGGMNPGPAQPWDAGERPWDRDEFSAPVRAVQLDHLSDAALVLRDMWEGKVELEGDPEGMAYVAEDLAPLPLRFPGLAPASDQPLSQQEREAFLGSLPAARIGLAPAGRPADVLPLIGWDGTVNPFGDALPVTAVLRSWEERFGATLLQVGFAWIRLLIDRPPRTLAHAQQLAAEHYVFADECASHTGRALSRVADLAPVLLDGPLWSFWWD